MENTKENLIKLLQAKVEVYRSISNFAKNDLEKYGLSLGIEKILDLKKQIYEANAEAYAYQGVIFLLEDEDNFFNKQWDIYFDEEGNEKND